LYHGSHSIGSPFAPRCLPGPLCAATSSIRGSRLSFRECTICIACLVFLDGVDLTRTCRNCWCICKFQFVCS
jgi:hypothetical protein